MFWFCAEIRTLMTSFLLISYVSRSVNISDQILAELWALGLHKPMHCDKTMARQCRKKCRENKGVAWQTDLLWQQWEFEALFLSQIHVHFNQKKTKLNWGV